MPKFYIRELQHVIAARIIEADDEDAALDLFNDGFGDPAARDGDVTDSNLLEVTEVDE